MQRFISSIRALPNSAPRVAAPCARAAGIRYKSTAVEDYSSPDHYYETERVNAVKGDASKRAFAYFVLGGARVVYASAVRVAAIKFIGSMSPSADVLALASAEFDLSEIQAGETITVKWRGKPVFIRHRTEEEISDSAAVDVQQLRDPQGDLDRVIKPEWLVVLGICTHLGCVPVGDAGEYNGWYCPCHGSHYDISGRIRKGPAPLNLEVPPYEFIAEDKIKLG